MTADLAQKSNEESKGLGVMLYYGDDIEEEDTPWLETSYKNAMLKHLIQGLKTV